jgi:hypothetical protein
MQKSLIAWGNMYFMCRHWHINSVMRNINFTVHLTTVGLQCALLQGTFPRWCNQTTCFAGYAELEKFLIIPVQFVYFLSSLNLLVVVWHGQI